MVSLKHNVFFLTLYIMLQVVYISGLFSNLLCITCNSLNHLASYLMHGDDNIITHNCF